jgi:8-oxo-dGTP pyrophosphatase MutT (NUDIX family)
MISYVLGFAFTTDKSQVVLIRKNRPDWQRGFWNGIGGVVQESESELDAMVREFKEETGVTTLPSEWTQVGLMRGKDWQCPVFAMKSEKVRNVRKLTDELPQLTALSWIDKTPEFYVENVALLVKACTLPVGHTGQVPLITLDYT